MTRELAAQRRVLPLGDVPAAGALAALSGGLVCLAALALAASAGAESRLTRLMAEPRQMTVALATVPGDADEARMTRIIEEVRGVPGMVGLREVQASELRTLLPSGLFDPAQAGGARLPRLLEVGFLRDSAPDASALEDRLRAIAPGVTVGSPPTDFAARAAEARRVIRLGWFGAGLSLLGLVVGVASVARWSLTAQAESVRLFRTLGAGETHVAQQFEEHAARAALAGAGIGLFAALGILAVLALGSRLWPEAGLVEPRLTPADWLRLAAVPLAGGLIAGWVARLTVRLGLARLR